MKLIHGNGKELEVYDLADPVMRMRAKDPAVPIKFNGWMIYSDDEAREKVREFLGTGLYEILKENGMVT